jgi:hypothetical protein
MPRATSLPFFFVCCLYSFQAAAWGFDGHRQLSSMMHEPLPNNHCLKRYLASKQSAALQNRSVDADRQRDSSNPSYDPQEAPRHFLDIDEVMPVSSYPRDYNQAIAQFGSNNALRNGTVPWRVESQYQVLVDAFRAKDSTKILDTAFFMSHYVTDAFSILHNTTNFNDRTNIHSRWESEMVSANRSQLTESARKMYGTPGLINPRMAIFDIVIVGNSKVAALYEANSQTLNDLTAFYRQTEDLTARRWGDAVTTMASVVWTAWFEAGSPMLAEFEAGCVASRPTQRLQLLGLPPVGGWTWQADAGPELDAGTSVPVDAGQSQVDAGPGAEPTVVADAGLVDGGSPSLPINQPSVNGELERTPSACGCQVGVWPLWALLMLVSLRRLTLNRHQ